MGAHPELNDYITSVLSSARLLLDKKAIEKVVLTITIKARTYICQLYALAVPFTASLISSSTLG